MSIIYNFNFENLKHAQQRARVRGFTEEQAEGIVRSLNLKMFMPSNFEFAEIRHCIKKDTGHDIPGTVILIKVDKEKDVIDVDFERSNDNGAFIASDYYGNEASEYIISCFYENTRVINSNGRKSYIRKNYRLN